MLHNVPQPDCHWRRCAPTQEVNLLLCCDKTVTDTEDLFVNDNVRRRGRFWTCGREVFIDVAAPACWNFELVLVPQWWTADNLRGPSHLPAQLLPKHKREQSCILGVYHTAATLWGAERGRKSSITPNPSPEFTSVLYCSCSFSHPGWIHRGGEWPTLLCRSVLHDRYKSVKEKKK